jgi:hypothetical protein
MAAVCQTTPFKYLRIYSIQKCIYTHEYLDSTLEKDMEYINTGIWSIFTTGRGGGLGDYDLAIYTKVKLNRKRYI